MAERIAATRGDPRRPAASSLAPVEPAPLERLRHCWVTDEHGRRPALLLEWRFRAAAGVVGDRNSPVAAFVPSPHGVLVTLLTLIAVNRTWEIPPPPNVWHCIDAVPPVT